MLASLSRHIDPGRVIYSSSRSSTSHISFFWCLASDGRVCRRPRILLFEVRLYESLRVAGARGLKTSSWEPGRPENHDLHDFCDFGHLGRSSWSPIRMSISSYGQATDLRLSPNDAEYLTVCWKNMRSQNELTDFEKFQKNLMK